MTVESATLILSPEAILLKLKRMAFEVAEQNVDATSMVVFGVQGNGEMVADAITKHLQHLLSIPIERSVIELDKTAPIAARISGNFDLDGKLVLVVDDVSNTGRTLLYALAPLLQSLPRKIQTLVLVERSHKEFAVQPDFVGLSVATTLQEHIRVEAEDGVLTGAWLY